MTAIDERELSRPRVLLVDDERELCDVLAYNLAKAGHDVRCAYEGRQALRLADEFRPDVVILDVLMPEMNGLEVARRLRESPTHARTPILMLTALGSEDDEVRGLGAGADDYVAKPYSVKVIAARVDALLRRVRTSAPRPTSRMSLGPLQVDTQTHQATCMGAPLRLTVTEFRLLAALVGAEGRVLSRASMIKEAMGPGVTVTERTIDVHVTSIRKKLGREHAGMIKTVRGVGYRATLEPESTADAPEGEHAEA